MIGAIKKAYSGGWRAGAAETPFYRPGGTRGVLRVSCPLNPYHNRFTARWRPLLALAWDAGKHAGQMYKFNIWLMQRRAAQCAQ